MCIAVGTHRRGALCFWAALAFADMWRGDMSRRDRSLRVGLIGFGAIGRMVFDTLNRNELSATTVAVLVRPGRVADLKTALPQSIAIVSRVEELASLELDLVTECAGQDAVVEYGEAVLQLGIDLMIIATGALADDS